jgi:hypothetical protein
MRTAIAVVRGTASATPDASDEGADDVLRDRRGSKKNS